LRRCLILLEKVAVRPSGIPAGTGKTQNRGGKKKRGLSPKIHGLIPKECDAYRRAWFAPLKTAYACRF